jgi:hypothetical protein
VTLNLLRFVVDSGFDSFEASLSESDTTLNSTVTEENLSTSFCKLYDDLTR